MSLRPVLFASGQDANSVSFFKLGNTHIPKKHVSNTLQTGYLENIRRDTIPSFVNDIFKKELSRKLLVTTIPNAKNMCSYGSSVTICPSRRDAFVTMEIDPNQNVLNPFDVTIITKHSEMVVTHDSHTYKFPGPTLLTNICQTPQGFSFNQPELQLPYEHPFVFPDGTICYRTYQIWDDLNIKFRSSALDSEFARNIVSCLRQTHSLLGSYNNVDHPVMSLTPSNFRRYLVQ